MLRVVIIGGGISGLSTAYHLAKAEVPSTIVERRPRLGGVIQTEIVEGCVVEGGPDSFLSAKPAALELIHELGMSAEIIGSNDSQRVTYISRAGKLLPLPDGLMMMVPTRIAPMISTRLLGWPTKIRMGLDCLRRPPRGPFGDRSVACLIRDHYGQEAVDYLAEPLLSGVYGGDPEQLSATSVLAMFVDLERSYGSLSRGVLYQRRRSNREGARPALFQTLRGGLGSLVEALARASSPLVTTVTSVAETLERKGAGFLVRLQDGTLEADVVVLGCQAHEAADLLRGIDGQLAARLGEVPYTSSITISLGFSKSEYDGRACGFGFLVPLLERRRLVAATSVGTKFPYRTPDGMVMLRCFFGGPAEKPSEEADDSLVEEARAELRETLGLTAAPVFSRVSRWPRSMAQYTVGHARRVQEIRQRADGIAGLFLAGNAYSGIGVPDCARMGKEAATRILALR
jgi:oxygen-dependent protoporphyrinogen oxidase